MTTVKCPIRDGFATRETDPNYPALVAKAAARGFEPAPLWMLLDDGRHNDVLYPWRGRVWVRRELNEAANAALCGPSRGQTDEP
jgi:hypothetical protein